MGNGGGDNTMMMVMIGLVCCCCFAISATLGGLYFMHDGFKKWVNGLFGKGGEPTTEELLKNFSPGGKCTWWGRKSSSAAPGVWTCSDPNLPIDVGFDYYGVKNQSPLVPGATWQRFEHIQCVANEECKGYTAQMKKNLGLP